MQLPKKDKCDRSILLLAPGVEETSDSPNRTTKAHAFMTLAPGGKAPVLPSMLKKENKVNDKRDVLMLAPGVEETESDSPNRTARYRSNIDHARSSTGDDVDAASLDSDDQPGAIHVGGPGHTSPSVSDEQTEQQTTGQNTTDQTAVLSAEKVDDDELMERAKTMVISNAAQAEAINLEQQRKRNKKRAILLCFAVTTLVTAIAVGFGVGFSNFSDGTFSSWVSTETIEAQLFMVSKNKYEYTNAIRYSSEDANGVRQIRTDGISYAFYCTVLPCLSADTHEHDGSCKSRDEMPIEDNYYEPGCCLGPECPNETKCGSHCPPDSCRPVREDCRAISCFQCDTDHDGSELYELIDVTFTINCLATGTKIDPINNEEYTWAIICGPNESGGEIRANFGVGEYTCAAHRQGGSKNFTEGYLIPCQYIQLSECGCAPLDVFPFELEPPDHPCLTEDDCPFLCSDAGEERAKNLCYAFGGIDWWEGGNFWNKDFMIMEFDGDPETITEITIYEEEDVKINSGAGGLYNINILLSVWLLVVTFVHITCGIMG